MAVVERSEFAVLKRAGTTTKRPVDGRGAALENTSDLRRPFVAAAEFLGVFEWKGKKRGSFIGPGVNSNRPCAA